MQISLTNVHKGEEGSWQGAVSDFVAKSQLSCKQALQIGILKKGYQISQQWKIMDVPACFKLVLTQWSIDYTDYSLFHYAFHRLFDLKDIAID